MSREAAIAASESYFDDDRFFEDLSRRVAIATESQIPEQQPELYRYLEQEMTPSFERMGFTCEVFPNPSGDAEPPFLVARRDEGDDLLTVFGYGHGDAVRGDAERWRDGLSPWRLEKDGDRWYGRGTADNKGQHSINMAAIDAVLGERGRLGYNVVFLIETGEERGSPGLHEFCSANRDRLSADILLASDGPRLTPDRPTLFMGTRGVVNFDLTLELREGGHHSGNWGGLLANPAIVLAHAISTLASASGQILVPELRPPPIPDSVREAIRGLEVGGGHDAPAIDPDWGEPGLTTSEQVYGWNSFEVLAFTAGNPDRPENAVPPRARAHCQVRFVVPCEPDSILAGVRRHLDDAGFDRIEVTQAHEPMNATRLDPQHPWVRWAASSIERTCGQPPAIVPNLGGSLPNDVFAELLGLPTLWVPHSYGGCSQHAPDEHLLDWIARDALRIMTGLFWDLGEADTPNGR